MIKMKQEKQEVQNKSKGFTLLELLVVVVIIGILAAIALPQYQMAVGKAKFSTLKDITKSVLESAQRYYLLHNIYPRKSTDLDISFDIIRENNDSYFLSFEISDGISCTIWNETSQNYVACNRKIFGDTMVFYMNRDKGIPSLCLVYSIDTGDYGNRLCQKETGKSKENAGCSSTYCNYYY